MGPVMQFRWVVSVLLLFPLVLSNPRRPRWQAYSSSSYIYTDYNYAKPFYLKKQSKFVPEPQYCPNTGRTVCNEVKNYPAEHIYSVVKRDSTPFLTRDEREGDSEPDMNLLPSGPSKKQHDGYVVYQTSVHYNYPNYPPLPSVPWGYAVPGPSQSVPMRRRPIMRRQAEEVKTACPVTTRYLPPLAALNDNAQWKYVVNVQEKDPVLKQIIRVEVCQNPDTPCTSEISLPFGYTSKCKQKYMKKALVALNENGTGTTTENFFIPSCCVCHVSRVR